MVARAEQSLKAQFTMVVREGGRLMVVRAEQKAKAESPILVTEGGKSTVVRDRQYRKAQRPTAVTPALTPAVTTSCLALPSGSPHMLPNSFSAPVCSAYPFTTDMTVGSLPLRYELLPYILVDLGGVFLVVKRRLRFVVVGGGRENLVPG